MRRLSPGRGSTSQNFSHGLCLGFESGEGRVVKVRWITSVRRCYTICWKSGIAIEHNQPVSGDIQDLDQEVRSANNLQNISDVHKQQPMMPYKTVRVVEVVDQQLPLWYVQSRRGYSEISEADQDASKNSEAASKNSG